MDTKEQIQSYLRSVSRKWTSGSKSQGRIFITTLCRKQLEIIDAPDHHVYEALKGCHVDFFEWRRQEILVEVTAKRPGYGSVELSVVIAVHDKPSDYVVWVNDFEVI